MSGAPSPLMQFVPLLFLFGVFYFLLIRPQQQKQKEHTAMLSKLDKNDEVITSGGVHGTIVSVGDKTVGLRIADNVKIEIEKTSIASVVKKRTNE
jgi:preprotein translocase subunit YajC